MKISVVGSGYVGLVTGICFAQIGHEVTGIDIDPKRVAALQEGQLPIYEPGLDDAFLKAAELGRLSFATDFASCAESDVVFICVGTPPAEDGSASLQFVRAAARAIGAAIEEAARDRRPVVATKSTVPPGTWREVQKCLRQEGAEAVEVASCPEFLKEGRAVDDFMRPDRVVIGANTAQARKVLRDLHEPILRSVGRVFECDPTSAELAKYAANAMLFTRIALMNEIARICDGVGADVDAVRQIVGSDRRIGPTFLFPGPGVGGSCFRKDIEALHHAGKGAGVRVFVPEAVWESDSYQRELVAERILHVLEGQGGRVALWGLTFKPGTDDVRESPALDVARMLLNAGVEVRGYDPRVQTLPPETASGLNLCGDPYDAARGADVLCLLTEWPEFKVPNWPRVRDVTRGRTVVDARNLWDPVEVRSYGFGYIGMGRGRL